MLGVWPLDADTRADKDVICVEGNVGTNVGKTSMYQKTNVVGREREPLPQANRDAARDRAVCVAEERCCELYHGWEEILLWDHAFL